MYSSTVTCFWKPTQTRVHVCVCVWVQLYKAGCLGDGKKNTFHILRASLKKKKNKGDREERNKRWREKRTERERE